MDCNDWRSGLFATSGHAACGMPRQNQRSKAQIKGTEEGRQKEKVVVMQSAH
jgi:hypothetical protein